MLSSISDDRLDGEVITWTTYLDFLEGAPNDYARQAIRKCLFDLHNALSDTELERDELRSALRYYYAIRDNGVDDETGKKTRSCSMCLLEWDSDAPERHSRDCLARPTSLSQLKEAAKGAPA